MNRSARIASIAIAAMTCIASSAHADDVVTISAEDPGTIGIDECLTQIGNEFTLRASVEFDSTDDERTPVYRMYYFTGEAACYRADGLETCPQHIVDDAGKPCGCFYETTSLSSNTFSINASLSAIMGAQAGEVCSQDAPAEVKFVAESYRAAEGELTSESIASENFVALPIDRERPNTPTAAPRVQAVESGLLVNAEAIAEGNVRYEVCVRQVGSGVDPIDGSVTTNETLREGFTQCEDVGISPPSDHRITGLTNGNNYEVVYAAIDEAGNRGANSPSANGMPLPQNDFAEQYTASLGGQIGETGGCSATPGRDPAGLAWIALGLLAVIRRRRS